MFSKNGFFENEMGEGDGMKYMTLTKIYYAMPALYEEIYEARYHAPFTFQFGISIRQYHRKNAYPAAFFYGRGVTITELADMVGKARNTIQKRLDSMPVNHLIVEKKGKTNFYKLDLLMFKESGSRRPV